MHGGSRVAVPSSFMTPRIVQADGDPLRDVRIELTIAEALMLLEGLQRRLEPGCGWTDWRWKITDAEGRELTISVVDEPPSEPTQPATSVSNCPRCGQDHKDVEWSALSPPIDEGARTATHWALCPNTGERITRAVVASIQAGPSVAERWTD
jgi:hypothetical protein